MSNQKLRKVLTNPIVGQRPNAPLETWNKLKKATAELRGKSPEVPESGSPDLVENGPNGEILLWFAANRSCQVWDWGLPGSHYSGPSMLFSSPSKNFTSDYTGNSLNLISSFTTDAKVLAMAIFPCHYGNVLLLLQESDSQNRYLQGFYDSTSQTAPLLPSLTQGTLQMKVSSEFVIVSSSEGYLNIFKVGSPTRLLEHVTGEPLLALENCTRPVIAHDGLDEISIKNAFVKTSVSGDLPIYDIVGSWLVYAPTQVEINYFKKLYQSKEHVPVRAKSNAYTPVKLPSEGPLLSRVLSALSNSAADTLSSLTDLSTKAVKKSKDLIEKDISLKSVSSSIGSTLYTTASTMYSNSSKLVKFGGETQLVKIFDLSSGNTIALFKAPGGVSHLSLNEYDLQLAQANARGDSIYLWDLYKLPEEVSLVGNFSRGKTSAKIREMIWFMSNDTIDGHTVSNSGLGCITERSGSIHWFHTNYLFSGKERENQPNVSRGNGTVAHSKSASAQFLNIWTLPSLGAVKFMKLPSYSNVSDEVKRSDFKNPSVRDKFSRLNQLAYVDGNLNLRLVSTLNGKHNFKYVLPKQPCEHVSTDALAFKCGPLSYRSEPVKVEQVENPISQAEIETCKQYVTFIQDENSNIAVYNFDETAGDPAAFWAHFAVFGSDIGHITRDFHNVRHSDGPSQTPIVA